MLLSVAENQRRSWSVATRSSSSGFTRVSRAAAVPSRIQVGIVGSRSGAKYENWTRWNSSCATVA
jgi:hypothetical protein